MINPLPLDKALFYLFFIIFSLLPISFAYLGPLLIFLYVICFLHFFLMLTKGWDWRPAIAVGSIFAYLILYLFYLFYSFLISTEDQELIFKDSIGFIFYPAYLPLIALMVKFKINRNEWELFLITLGITISVFHAAAYFAFFQIFSELTLETLTVANLFLSDFGAASKFATGAGVLRIDSGLGVLLMLPSLITLSRILRGVNINYNITILSVLIIGVVLEGHRALLIVVAGGVILNILWFIFSGKNRIRTMCRVLKIIIILTAFFFVLAAMYADDMQIIFARFGDFSNGSGSGAALDSERLEQFFPLIEKITDSPFLGSGFGSHASLIRNLERPFMYELDYLAVFMKLGLIGGSLYFLSYIYFIYLSFLKIKSDNQNIIYFISGVCYFVYAGTNGGFAMSIFSTLFHLYLMIGISIEYYVINKEKKC